jgi:magnesium transporter
MAQPKDHLMEPVVAFARKDFTSLPADLTIDEALSLIRQKDIGETIIYFYVVDSEQRLVGVLPTRRLLTAQLDQKVRDVMMSRVVAIPESATVLDACELFLMHKFLAFPIIDQNRRLIGAVDVGLFTTEVFDISERERMDDVFQTIGFHIAAVQRATSLQSFRHRFPWLLATMAGGTICAFLAGAYEATLADTLVLAFFLALVLGLGESVSVQSLAVTVQALHVQPVTLGWIWNATRKEVATAMMLGLASGGIVAIIAWLWRGGALPALVIGVSLFVAMTVASLIGLLIPTALHYFKLDPKIAAGPVALALADVCTLIFYFNIARWMLG